MENSSTQQKVLTSEFYLWPRSKPPLQNCLIDSQDFFTQTAQGSRHIKSKIKYGMADTVLHVDMTTESPNRSFWNTQYTWFINWWSVVFPSKSTNAQQTKIGQTNITQNQICMYTLWSCLNYILIAVLIIIIIMKGTSRLNDLLQKWSRQFTFHYD